MLSVYVLAGLFVQRDTPHPLTGECASFLARA